MPAWPPLVAANDVILADHLNGLRDNAIRGDAVNDKHLQINRSAGRLLTCNSWIDLSASIGGLAMVGNNSYLRQVDNIRIWANSGFSFAGGVYFNPIAGSTSIWNSTDAGTADSPVTGIRDNLVVLDPGKVGIRTTVPETMLHLVAFAGLPAAITLNESSDTPASPGTNNQARVYVKSDKLVIQFNDLGTVRYKYLDLAGTGVTWVHTTVAP